MMLRCRYAGSHELSTAIGSSVFPVQSGVWRCSQAAQMLHPRGQHEPGWILCGKDRGLGCQSVQMSGPVHSIQGKLADGWFHICVHKYVAVKWWNDFVIGLFVILVMAVVFDYLSGKVCICKLP